MCFRVNFSGKLSIFFQSMRFETLLGDKIEHFKSTSFKSPFYDKLKSVRLEILLSVYFYQCCNLVIILLMVHAVEGGGNCALWELCLVCLCMYQLRNYEFDIIDNVNL